MLANDRWKGYTITSAAGANANDFVCAVQNAKQTQSSPYTFAHWVEVIWKFSCLPRTSREKSHQKCDKSWDPMCRNCRENDTQSHTSKLELYILKTTSPIRLILLLLCFHLILPWKAMPDAQVNSR
ncbi:hypothetical protein DMENIID0001_008930 [Sergentomyia squamirostris]